MSELSAVPTLGAILLGSRYLQVPTVEKLAGHIKAEWEKVW